MLLTMMAEMIQLVQMVQMIQMVQMVFKLVCLSILFSQYFLGFYCQFKFLVPPFFLEWVLLPFYYMSTEHRRMEGAWPHADYNVRTTCGLQCGVFSLRCGTCGLMIICYSCFQNMTGEGRRTCSSCKTNPLEVDFFRPLY